VNLQLQKQIADFLKLRPDEIHDAYKIEQGAMYLITIKQAKGFRFERIRSGVIAGTVAPIWMIKEFSRKYTLFS
jgi:hypothetical protein